MCSVAPDIHLLIEQLVVMIELKTQVELTNNKAEMNSGLPRVNPLVACLKSDLNTQSKHTEELNKPHLDPQLGGSNILCCQRERSALWR